MNKSHFLTFIFFCPAKTPDIEILLWNYKIIFREQFSTAINLNMGRYQCYSILNIIMLMTASSVCIEISHIVTWMRWGVDNNLLHCISHMSYCKRDSKLDQWNRAALSIIFQVHHINNIHLQVYQFKYLFLTNK